MPTINDFNFGAELELYLPVGVTHQQAADAVARRIGKTVRVMRYGHEYVPYWKVVTDGSLDDYVRGCEFVGPKLRGPEGFAELAAVCEALSDLGATVSKMCGFHVHVGAEAMTLAHHKNLARNFQAYEKTMDAMMPPSRRGSPRWCRTLQSVTTDAINSATSIDDLARRIQRTTGAPEPRYHKLNFAAYERHKTVEFRQHSGTLEATKAVSWVKACLSMVVAAMTPTPVVVTSTAIATVQANKARPGSKVHQIGQMFLRPEGVTAPEVLAVTGWPSVSMNAQAKAAGLTVFKVRQGRIVRYFASRADSQAPVAMNRTLQGWTQWLNLDETLTAYFKMRTENLSGPVAWVA